MRLGANDSFGMTSGSWGYTPVFLNPPMIFLGVMDEFQDGMKTSQKLTLLRTRPLWVLLYFIKLDSQCFLREWNRIKSLKKVRSVGWNCDNFNIICPHGFVER